MYFLSICFIVLVEVEPPAAIPKFVDGQAVQLEDGSTAYIHHTHKGEVEERYYTNTHKHTSHTQTYITHTNTHDTHKHTSHTQTHITHINLHHTHKHTSHTQTYITHKHTSHTHITHTQTYITHINIHHTQKHTSHTQTYITHIKVRRKIDVI